MTESKPIPDWFDVAEKKSLGTLILSRKQRLVLDYIILNENITLTQAISLIGSNIYANESKHVGALLANMVRRGLIVRVRRGVFALPKATP